MGLFDVLKSKKEEKKSRSTRSAKVKAIKDLSVTKNRSRKSVKTLGDRSGQSKKLKHRKQSFAAVVSEPTSASTEAEKEVDVEIHSPEAVEEETEVKSPMSAISKSSDFDLECMKRTKNSVTISEAVRTTMTRESATSPQPSVWGNARDVAEGVMDGTYEFQVPPTSPTKIRRKKSRKNKAGRELAKEKDDDDDKPLSVDVARLNYWFQFLNKSTDGGYLVWPIHPYSKIRKEHSQDKDAMLTSPTFYSGGYKMRALANLSGVGEFRGRHISVYWQLLKGRFDADLPWPFNRKVTVYLMPSKNSSPIEATTFPVPEHESFQRPEEPANQPWGFKKFCNAQEIEAAEYNRNDTLWFIIRVHPAEDKEAIS